MITLAHRCLDISGRIWEKLEPHFPWRREEWGGVTQDNRQFINPGFWIIRTGVPPRDLPPDYGNWGNVHRRLEKAVVAPDCSWLMIDALHLHVQ